MFYSIPLNTWRSSSLKYKKDNMLLFGISEELKISYTYYHIWFQHIQVYIYSEQKSRRTRRHTLHNPR